MWSTHTHRTRKHLLRFIWKVLPTSGSSHWAHADHSLPLYCTGAGMQYPTAQQAVG